MTDLKVMVVNAFTNLGFEGSVDFHEGPVFQRRSVLSSGIIVALPAVTAFNHFK